MKRILMSGGLLAFAAVVAVSATGAFFSDTETSTGNTFTAGAIDLKIDNTSYVTNPEGTLVASPNNTWQLSDLTNQLFFSFADLKPGDIGEDTISVHAGSNNAWACMALATTSTPDNGINDPEAAAGDTTDGPNGGELQNFLNFAFWNDDGDNVFETGETGITQLTGPASSIFNGNWLTLADSGTGTSSAILANSTRYIGKAWCFGTLTPAPLANNASTSPLVRGTGFTCNGAGNNNIAQTDGIVVDVSFYAVQARNNGQFLCSSLPRFTGSTTPQAPTTGGLVVTKVVNGGNSVASNFILHLKSATTSADAIGQFNGSGSGTNISGLVAGTYFVTEDATSTYNAVFSTSCTSSSTPFASNSIIITPGATSTCTVTNSTQ